MPFANAVSTSVVSAGVHLFTFKSRLGEDAPEEVVAAVLIPDAVFRQMEDHFVAVRAAREQARQQG